MSLRKSIAYYICPALKAEVDALRDGNTRLVLEHGKLLDRLLTRAPVGSPKETNND